MESRRLYKLKYIDNLERAYDTAERTIQPFDVGNIGHHGLKARFLGHSDAFVQAAMRWYVRKNQLVDSLDKKELSVQAALDAYRRNDTYLAENKVYDNYEIVAVEKRLFLDMGDVLGDNVVLTFEPDLVVRDKFGLLHIVDWKFVASYDLLGAGIEANRQGLTYALGYERATGEGVTSFTLHQIHRKPPARSTTPFKPVERVTKFMDPAELQTHENYLRAQLRDMVRFHQEIEAGDEFVAYPYSKWTCNTMCSFRDICCGALAKGEQEVADLIATRYRQKEQEPWQ